VTTRKRTSGTDVDCSREKRGTREFGCCAAGHGEEELVKERKGSVAATVGKK
jgi:hypothetical protein